MEIVPLLDLETRQKENHQTFRNASIPASMAIVSYTNSSVKGRSPISLLWIVAMDCR